VYYWICVMLNNGLEWDKWVLTNLSHSIDRGLTHLFLGRTSHAWLHTSGVTTRMSAHEWIYDTLALGYTTLDSMLEIGSTSWIIRLNQRMAICVHGAVHGRGRYSVGSGILVGWAPFPVMGAYEGRSISSENQYIRLKYFSQDSYISLKCMLSTNTYEFVADEMSL